MKLNDSHPRPVPKATEDLSTDCTNPVPKATTSVTGSRALRKNWFHPARWETIHAVARLNGYKNVSEIVNQLQRGISGQEYKSLHRGTVSKWIDKENHCWTAETLAKVHAAAQSQDASDAPHLVKPGTTLGRRSIMVFLLLH